MLVSGFDKALVVKAFDAAIASGAAAWAEPAELSSAQGGNVLWCYRSPARICAAPGLGEDAIELLGRWARTNRSMLNLRRDVGLSFVNIDRQDWRRVAGERISLALEGPADTSASEAPDPAAWWGICAHLPQVCEVYEMLELVSAAPLGDSPSERAPGPDLARRGLAFLQDNSSLGEAKRSLKAGFDAAEAGAAQLRMELEARESEVADLLERLHVAQEQLETLAASERTPDPKLLEELDRAIVARDLAREARDQAVKERDLLGQELATARDGNVELRRQHKLVAERVSLLEGQLADARRGVDQSMARAELAEQKLVESGQALDVLREERDAARRQALASTELSRLVRQRLYEARKESSELRDRIATLERDRQSATAEAGALSSRLVEVNTELQRMAQARVEAAGGSAMASATRPAGLSDRLPHLRRRRDRRAAAGERARLVALLGQSGWLDAEWYLAKYPDVREAGLDPVEHYLDFGWKERRDPSPRFDTMGYLMANLDVAKSGTNPLVHFLEHGLAEGRPPGAGAAAGAAAG